MIFLGLRMEKEKEIIDEVLADMNTIKNILQESSPHNHEDAIVRPVNCKCGSCLMETMISRSYIKLSSIKGRKGSSECRESQRVVS